MVVRDAETHGRKWYGISTEFNTCTLNEVIVSFKGLTLNEWDEPDEVDSICIDECEVFLKRSKKWKLMSRAFEDRDLIVNDRNICFFESWTEADKENATCAVGS